MLRWAALYAAGKGSMIASCAVSQRRLNRAATNAVIRRINPMPIRLMDAPSVSAVHPNAVIPSMAANMPPVLKVVMTRASIWPGVIS